MPMASRLATSAAMPLSVPSGPVRSRTASERLAAEHGAREVRLAAGVDRGQRGAPGITKAGRQHHGLVVGERQGVHGLPHHIALQ